MAAPSPKHALIYDDHCSFCTFQMRVLTWLDWLGKIRLQPLSHPDTATVAAGITPEALHEAMHCITPEGRIYRGARCIRFLSARLPLAIPLALILWIPGVIWVAEWVYVRISRNRYILSRWMGCDGACAILPARQRVDDKTAATSTSTPRG